MRYAYPLRRDDPANDGDAGSDRKDERTIEITGSVPHKRYESKSPGRQEKLFGRFSKRRKDDENTA